ncbi:hypothetical protein SASPL_142443 [Salvia splendens]|uniref:RRM domain-containing protein n=1 Tax=Salvia splendens TaxID=180675 RepID=A0A8X8WK73_SALSN|nr:hypothetical protein SASPL_142443 [Salvia splendens]
MRCIIRACLILLSGKWPEDLRVPFERFGPVKDVYLPKNYYTGEPRGFGFVKFRDPEDAADAKSHMDRTVIGGREIRIVFAEENRKTPQEMRRVTRTRLCLCCSVLPLCSRGSHRRRSPSYSPRRRYHLVDWLWFHKWQLDHHHPLQQGTVIQVLDDVTSSHSVGDDSVAFLLGLRLKRMSRLCLASDTELTLLAKKELICKEAKPFKVIMNEVCDSCVFDRDRGYGASQGRYSRHRSRSMSRSVSPEDDIGYRSSERHSRPLLRSVSPLDEKNHLPSLHSPSPRENGHTGYAGSRSPTPRRNSLSPERRR